MLEGLSQVAWSELEHAYGSAADVPDLIRALRSPDSGTRQNARWSLYGNIFHQGSRYEASAYAVPFLLELLADPDTADRTEILGLLTSLAIGYDEAWLPDGFPIATYREQADGGEQMFADVELAVYDAVRVGVPLYRALLIDGRPAIRTAAAYALAWFSEDAIDSAAALRSAAADPDAVVAATALVALGLTGTHDASTRQTIQAALTGQRDIVRWGAAVALARLDGRTAEPRTTAELLAWAGGASESDAGVPYLEGDLAGYAALALRDVGDNQADAAFDALLARIPLVSGQESVTVVGEALRSAFPGGAIAGGTSFGALDHKQQRLLQALADSPATWRLGEYQFGNFSLMLGGYGLPSDVGAMRSFVG